MIGTILLGLGIALIILSLAGLIRHAWRQWRAARHRKRNAQIAAHDAARRALHMDRMAGRREGK